MPPPCLPPAGFYAAWLSGGFSRKVMDRLKEIDDSVDGDMRFWVTGGWLWMASWLAGMGVAFLGVAFLPARGTRCCGWPAGRWPRLMQCSLPS